MKSAIQQQFVDPDLETWFSRQVDWPDAILPAYTGGSIGNLAASILAALEVESTSEILPAVDPELLPPDLVNGARIIMLIVLDGLGALNLHALENPRLLGGLASAHYESILTSTFPPSTAAATTTIQTGFSPAQHGLAAYTMYLAKMGRVFNMINWRSVPRHDSDARDAPNPESFITTPTLYEQLAEGQVDSTVVANAAFRDTALTTIHSKGVRYRGHRTLSDLSRRLLREVERPGRRFVYGYWDGIDVVSHLYGPDSAAAQLEIRLTAQAIREGLLNQLEGLGDDVAVLITADHGQIGIPIEERQDLSAVQGLVSRLQRRPAGEPRGLGLALKDAEDRLRLNETFSAIGTALATKSAIQTGLYGPGKPHPDLVGRLGDTLLLARGATAYSFPGSNTGMLGGHGSLTPEEMLVPLRVWRFG